MDLVGPPHVIGEALGLLEELGRAAVDLRRRHEAADPVAVGGVVTLVEGDCAPESLATRLLVR